MIYGAKKAQVSEVAAVLSWAVDTGTPVAQQHFGVCEGVLASEFSEGHWWTLRVGYFMNVLLQYASAIRDQVSSLQKLK
jgi:hypothetical protein